MVGGTKAAPGIAMEIFVKKKEVFPSGVGSIAGVAAVTCTGPIGLTLEDGAEAARDFLFGFVEADPLAGSGGELHAEGISVELAVTPERLDEQEIDGKPDRAAPV